MVSCRGNTVSKLLEEAIAKLTELSGADQDFIAAWLLEEMESEQGWEKVFSESHEALGHLADGALAEHLSDRTVELDPDKL